MPHPAIRPAAVARLQSRLSTTVAAALPTSDARPTCLSPGTRTTARSRVTGCVRRLTGQAARPVLDRLVARISQADRYEVETVRIDIAELRRELERTRSDLEADVALLRAELASRTR